MAVSPKQRAWTMDIERIEKSACHIILGEDYFSYKNALKTFGMDALKIRRDRLSLNFAKKAERYPRHKNWFKLNDNSVNTRQEKMKYSDVTS